ncbi:hypothetical protein M1567_02170, partial [Candidatus Marsarchaeota archaeon]|nr:hypothetical protein [Candidatus Marsarchaeota archaeon]
MGMFKTKEESKEKSNESKEGLVPRQASALLQQSSQKQEEKYTGLLRENTNRAEKRESNKTRKNSWENSTKVEKISVAIGIAGTASMFVSGSFAVSALATGTSSSAALVAYGAGFTAMIIGAAGLYGSLIMKKLSKK